MSTGLELIPLALAIGVAVSERRKARTAVAVRSPAPLYAMETRIRDGELLTRALERLGSTTSVTDGTVTTMVENIEATFAMPAESDVYDAHFEESVPEERARDLVLRLDEIYQRVVQESVREKVLQRADEHGLVVRSETVEEDGSMLLTLEVAR